MSDFSDSESAGALFSKRRVDNIFDEMDNEALPTPQPPARSYTNAQRTLEEEYLWRHWFINNTRPADILRLFTRADGGEIRNRNHYKDRRKSLRKKYGESPNVIEYQGFKIVKGQAVPEQIASKFFQWLDSVGGRQPNGAIGGLLPFVNGVYGKGFEGSSFALPRRTTGSAAVFNMQDASKKRKYHDVADEDGDKSTEDEVEGLYAAIKSVSGRLINAVNERDQEEPDILAAISSDEELYVRAPNGGPPEVQAILGSTDTEHSETPESDERRYTEAEETQHEQPLMLQAQERLPGNQNLQSPVGEISNQLAVANTTKPAPPIPLLDAPPPQNGQAPDSLRTLPPEAPASRLQDDQGRCPEDSGVSTDESRHSLGKSISRPAQEQENNNAVCPQPSSVRVGPQIPQSQPPMRNSASETSTFSAQERPHQLTTQPRHVQKEKTATDQANSSIGRALTTLTPQAAQQTTYFNTFPSNAAPQSSSAQSRSISLVRSRTSFLQRNASAPVNLPQDQQVVWLPVLIRGTVAPNGVSQGAAVPPVHYQHVQQSYGFGHPPIPPPYHQQPPLVQGNPIYYSPKPQQLPRYSHQASNSPVHRPQQPSIGRQASSPHYKRQSLQDIPPSVMPATSPGVSNPTAPRTPGNSSHNSPSGPPSNRPPESSPNRPPTESPSNRPAATVHEQVSPAPSAKSTAPQNTHNSLPRRDNIEVIALDDQSPDENDQDDDLFVPLPKTPAISSKPAIEVINLLDSEDEEHHIPENPTPESDPNPSIPELFLSKKEFPIYSKPLGYPIEEHKEILKKQMNAIPSKDPAAALKRQIFEIQLKAIEKYGPGGQTHPLAREALREVIAGLASSRR